MKLLIDYCNSSQFNIYMFLIVGIVFYMASKALDNSNSNSIELCMAAVGKAGSFVLIMISMVSLLWIGKEYTKKEFNDYKLNCRVKATESLGGYKNLKEIKSSVATVTNGNEITLVNIEETSKQMEKTIIILSEDEMKMLIQ